MEKFMIKHKDEMISFIQTFLAIFAVDGLAVLTQLYSGDWSVMVLQAFGLAVARSIVKAILQLSFPVLFPKRVSNNK